MASRRRNAVRTVCDVVIALLVVVTYFVVVNVVKPATRGFFCDDESIRYPYRSDSVSPWLLGAISLLFVPAIISLVEFSSTSRRLRSVRQSPPLRREDDDGVSGNKVGNGHSVTPVGNSSSGSRSFASMCCRSASWSTAVIYGQFILGLTVTMLITEVGKLTIGRLRPHFIDVCKPNFTTIDCSQGYITDFECTSNVHPRLLSEARKSFPSGHTSMAVFVAVFLGYYLRKRISSGSSRVIWLVFDILLCSATFFTGLSRVHDNKHHWSDVLAGAVIGLVVALWMIIHMQKSVRWHYGPQKSDVEIVQQPINAPKAYAQQTCSIQNDNES